MKDWPRRVALVIASCFSVLALSAGPALCAGAPPPPAMSVTSVSSELTDGSPIKGSTTKTSLVEGSSSEGYPFTVQIANLGANIAHGFNPDTLDLRLQGRELAKLGKLVDGQANQVTFFVQRRPEDREVWQALLGSPSLDGKRTVVIGVGPTGQADLTYAPPGPPTATLILFNPITGSLTVGLLELALLGGVVGMASKTGLLRDGNSALPDWKQRPYSLARCQMAFWLVLITGAFLFVWGLTGEYDGIITPQSLILLGISGVTALSATTIDAAKAAGPATPATATSPGTPGPPVASGDFFKDLLTDDSGYTLQRVQALAWTVILGVVVVTSVYANLSLPQLDNNLLTLMGISSGLYVGFKFPEQHTGP